ncbi:MAG: NAD(P)H-dependent oxidoreductase subunit E, partial [Opitutaceae bacterium]|nr:NAD(P)H-dependent oxidoreductase subunit E [Opitutaceae bacterium]
CRTLSCALRGGYQICAEFEKQFGIHRGQTTPDGEVTLDFVECLASCGSGPVVMINDDLHEHVDAAKAIALADQIKAEAKARN